MITENLSLNIGEKLTFFQLFTEKKWKIEIPIIQRDYAQGRDSARDIRDTFLGSLLDHLNSDKNIDLDFVYGSISEIDNATFIPLDGQQRLTTLFLLHWYLALLDGETTVLKDFLWDGIKSNFSYKTRISSAEFCDALLSNGIDMNSLLPDDEGLNDSLSKTIQDSTWYFSTWKNDPTIQSMLTMLDAIHLKFKNHGSYFKKLIDTKNPIITFQFLNLREFKLTDDLYIKMNARGKQLTPFENFKANFEQHIGELNIPLQSNYKLISDTGEKVASVKDYFSHKIDTDWANLFWKFKSEKENTYDSQLMNFMRVVITNSYALKVSSENLGQLRLLIGKEDANEKKGESGSLSYIQYKALDCLDEALILDLIAILDIIEEDEHLRIYLPDNIYYDEERIFNEVIKNQLNYTERLQFYAFYHYLIQNGSIIGLEEWMRIIHNLTENTIYNNVEQFARSLKSIRALLSHSASIIDYISDESNPIVGFFEIQIIEERIKALLLKKGEPWSSAILDVEAHGYFKGQIGFVLNFSGIESYYALNKHCNWSDADNNRFFNSYTDYVEKASAVFTPSGLKTFSWFDFEWSEFNLFLWERALLTKGDYLLTANSNKSFLIDNDRDISWKSLLRDENLNMHSVSRRRFVKDVFDDPNFEARNITESLKKIIETSNVDDWRKYFIEEVSIFRYLGSKKFIRWESEEVIYLLEKVRMSGPHVEYYTFAFCEKYLKKKLLPPFSNPICESLSGDVEDLCCYMEDWNYKSDTYGMAVYPHKGSTLEIWFYNIIDGAGICKEIATILTDHSFANNDNKYSLVSDFDATYDTIKSLCMEFEKL